MTEIRNILHPTDFSTISRKAFGLACSLARDFQVPILVLHVAPLSVVIEGEMTADNPSQEFLNERWERLQAMKPPSPLPIKYFLVEGDPVEKILDFAAKVPCDLIVMGTHGRTGLQRLLMGSVAEKILRQAQCPVLTLKGPFGAHVPGDQEDGEAVLCRDMVEEAGDETFPASDPPGWSSLAVGPPTRK